VASLPTPEENVAGRAVLAGLRRLAEFQRTFVSDEDRRFALAPPQEGQLIPRAPGFFDYIQRLNVVQVRGWDPADKSLSHFLEQALQDGWYANLAGAVDLPTGVVEDPRNTNIFTLLPSGQAASIAVAILSGRGLEAQSDGDPATFVKNLEISLAVGRNLRNRTSQIPTSIGFSTAENAIRWVDRWLERLDGRPDLLRRALAALLRYESEPVPTFEDIRQAELLIVVNTFADPTTLPRSLRANESILLGPFDNVDLMRFSLEVPWEKVRFRRLLQAYHSLDETAGDFAVKMAPRLLRDQGARPFSKWKLASDPTPWASGQVQTRGALLRVALRLYQAETGKPAEQLTDLVPKYLPDVPHDPYDDKPFRYRLSRGETLRWPPDYYLPGASTPIHSGDPVPSDAKVVNTRDVPAGQGILWSVGDDRADDGGQMQAGYAPGFVRASDIIFLVPPPPSRPR
jgi:hypothetical protein